MTFSAAVLAGGWSKRFGSDKASFVWQGKSLLTWVLDSLQDADERFIVANRPYPESGLTVYADQIPGGDSLSGIHAALVHARHDWVAIAACDLPNLQSAYWAFLLSQIQPTRQAVAGIGPGGFAEPLAALYHRSLLADIEDRLRSNRLKLQAILDPAQTVRIPWSELEHRFGPRLFLNANTLEELTG
jgi:molybdopterin-guanine dinucleotide biosynthesis protein A